MVVLLIAALAWMGSRQAQAGQPAADAAALATEIAPTGTSAVATAVVPMPTATWHGPVLRPTPSPMGTGVEEVETPTAAATPGSGGPRDEIIGYPNVADGGGDDGTLRRVTVPILMYHYISTPPEGADIYRQDLSVPPEQFRAQMQYLADHHYTVISLYDLNLALRWGAPLPRRSVVLTFDDGYADAYEEAFPILQEFEYTATFFVITTRLDEGHPDYLSWEQAREMLLAGMSIESHTKDHVDLRGRDRSFLIYQILGSIESIEAHTGRRPHLFCYPAGRWDEGELALLPVLGIWAAVTTEGGIEHTTDETLLLRRVRISGDTDLATFTTLLSWSWDRSAS